MKGFFSLPLLLLGGFYFFFNSSNVAAQSHYFDQWFFGNHAGLDFRSGVVRAVGGGAIETEEGSATICDPNTGELLFYTDGITVWNRNHQVMLNGTGLFGHSSSTQSALIVPLPQNNNIYYIFTADTGPFGDPNLSGRGIRYSIVEMNRNGGLGEVTSKNTPLLPKATEKLVAVTDCSGKEFWIVAHHLGSNEFFAWNLTANGLNRNPVVSSVGSVHPNIPGQLFFIGNLKASPDGKYLFSIVQQNLAGELFRFNFRTGQVSGRVDSVVAWYGASFSANSKYLYVGQEKSIYRYTLGGGAISSTKTLIPWPSDVDPSEVNGLQLGPDKKIYISYIGSSVLNGQELVRIRDADQVNSAVEKVGITFDISLNLRNLAFPNCIDGVFGVGVSGGPGDLTTDFRASDTTICVGESIDFFDFSGGNPSDYFWTFEGGIPNTATGRFPTGIRYASPGTYQAILTTSLSCNINSDTLQIVVTPLPVVDAGSDQTLCLGSSLQLQGNVVGEGKYEWSPSDDLSCRDCLDPIATPRESKTYYLTAETDAGCKAVDSVKVVVTDRPEVKASPDTTICAGSSINLSATGANRYEWILDSGLSCTDCPSPTATPTATTTYIVRGIVTDECEGYDTVVVTVLDPLKITATVGAAICPGESILLDVDVSNLPEEFLRFEWSSSETLDNPNLRRPTATPVGSTTYQVRVTDTRTGCAAIDSVQVTVNEPPIILSTRSFSLCPGESVQLSVEVANVPSDKLRYAWSSPETLDDFESPTPNATPLATTTYHVRVTDITTGCSAMDSVSVTLHAIPTAKAGEDGAICLGKSYLLGEGDVEENLRYEWFPTATLDNPESHQPVATPEVTTTYILHVVDTETNCESFDSVTVEVVSLPVADAGGDMAICVGNIVRLGSARGDVAGLLYEWSPATALDDPFSSSPLASPEQSTTYYLRVSDPITGCEAFDTVEIKILENLPVRAWIRRDYHARNGEAFPLSVSVEDIPTGSGITTLEFELTFNQFVMQVNPASIENLLSETLLEGWGVRVDSIAPGYIRVTLQSPNGQELNGSGTLLQFAGRMYLGTALGTELDFRLTSESQCVTLLPEPGYARLDTICGLNFRLIEVNAAKFAPPRAIPNPSGSQVKIELGLGLEGPARLEVFDAAGNRVGVLIDETLPAGEYGVDWDASGVGSGVYWLRLSSGETVLTGQVVVE
ncbi:MAG: T9SS type A sorting domain-containing protein [Candidatus Kapaibacterium sp.]